MVDNFQGKFRKRLDTLVSDLGKESQNLINNSSSPEAVEDLTLLTARYAAVVSEAEVFDMPGIVNNAVKSFLDEVVPLRVEVKARVAMSGKVNPEEMELLDNGLRYLDSIVSGKPLKKNKPSSRKSLEDRTDQKEPSTRISKQKKNSSRIRDGAELPMPLYVSHQNFEENYSGFKNAEAAELLGYDPKKTTFSVAINQKLRKKGIKLRKTPQGKTDWRGYSINLLRANLKGNSPRYSSSGEVVQSIRGVLKLEGVAEENLGFDADTLFKQIISEVSNEGGKYNMVEVRDSLENALSTFYRK